MQFESAANKMTHRLLSPAACRLREGTRDVAFDMNGDGQVTTADITAANLGWLAVGGANNAFHTDGSRCRTVPAERALVDLYYPDWPIQ